MKKVYIDLGHGGKDSGAINGKNKEKERVLKVGLSLKSKLLKTGKFEVKLSRESDIFLSLDERTQIANKWGADIFISIHCNSSTNTKATGIETYCFKFKYRKLADHINNGVLQYVTLTNRGVKEGNFHVLRETTMQACLVELAFISNSNDLSLLLNNVEQFASGIFKGIMDYYHYDINEKPNQNEHLYIVGVGAFENIENAKILMNEMKSKGISAYIHMC